MHTPSEWHRQTGRLQCTQDQVPINSLLPMAAPAPNRRTRESSHHPWPVAVIYWRNTNAGLTIPPRAENAYLSSCNTDCGRIFACDSIAVPV